MRETLWTAAEIAAATAGKCTGEFRASGIAIDPRQVQPGDLFVPALGGDRADLPMARGLGAVAALVDGSIATGPSRLPLVVVDDVYEALCDLARVARWRQPPAQRPQLALIVGTCGGTVRAEALGRILEEQGRTRIAQAQARPMLDVPLALANLPNLLSWSLIASGSGTVDSIRMAAPDLCWIAAPPRLGAGGAEALARSFEGVPVGSVALLDHEHPHFARLLAAARTRGLNVLSYGADPAAAGRILAMNVEGASRSIEVSIFGRRLVYRLQQGHESWASLSVGVLLAAAALGADVGWAAESLSGMLPPGAENVATRIAPAMARPAWVSFARS